jgi:hypothetical protein
MQFKTTKTNVKPFVFVLMPFHSDFDDVYQVGIKAACLSANAYCERVDEQIFVENILERVYNQIAKADIIISEMTGRNPNVFYETGYAHALKKQVILLTQNADDIPFDLKHYPHIVYGGKIAQLKTELEKRLRWYIENPIDSITNVDLDFELTLNGARWQEGLVIEVPCSYQTVDRYSKDKTGNLLFTLQVGIHNISNTVIEWSRYHIGLITPKSFTVERTSDVENTTLNGQNTIIRLRGFGTVFPDDWNSANITLVFSERDLLNSSTEFALRLFTVLGTKDFIFQVNPVTQQGG